MYPYSGAATSVPLLYDTRRAREEFRRDGEKMRRAWRQMKDDRGQTTASQIVNLSNSQMVMNGFNHDLTI